MGFLANGLVTSHWSPASTRPASLASIPRRSGPYGSQGGQGGLATGVQKLPIVPAVFVVSNILTMKFSFTLLSRDVLLNIYHEHKRQQLEIGIEDFR